MSCYQPYFARVPYFSLLSRCGFDEQGGTVDCIKTINNMSGINELMVAQDGSGVSRPEWFRKIEELLQLPPESSTSDLESRFQELCEVLQKARNAFNCQVEDEQENLFRELHGQLQKVKDRFHARIGEDAIKAKTNSSNIANPFQELRDAFRTMKKHFIPLFDEYVNGNSNISKGMTEIQNRDFGCQHDPIAVEISRTNAVDCSKILNTYSQIDDNGSKFQSSNENLESNPDKLVKPFRAGVLHANSDQSRASRLEALITKEIQRRHQVQLNGKWKGEGILPTTNIARLDSDKRAQTISRFSSMNNDESKSGYDRRTLGSMVTLEFDASPVSISFKPPEDDTLGEMLSTTYGRPKRWHACCFCDREPCKRDGPSLFKVPQRTKLSI